MSEKIHFTAENVLIDTEIRLKWNLQFSFSAEYELTMELKCAETAVNKVVCFLVIDATKWH